MSSFTPPPSHLPPNTTGRQPGTPAPTGQGDSRACPVCRGSGEVPSEMGREEMLQALDQNMPNPENPEQGELNNNASPFKQPLSLEQAAEVDRLGGRARNRMSSGPHLGS